MKIVHFEIVTEDQFDFSKSKRVLTRSEATFEALKLVVGKFASKGHKTIKIISVEKHICKNQICTCN